LWALDIGWKDKSSHREEVAPPVAPEAYVAAEDLLVDAEKGNVGAELHPERTNSQELPAEPEEVMDRENLAKAKQEAIPSGQALNEQPSRQDTDDSAQRLDMQAQLEGAIETGNPIEAGNEEMRTVPSHVFRTPQRGSKPEYLRILERHKWKRVSRNSADFLRVIVQPDRRSHHVQATVIMGDDDQEGKIVECVDGTVMYIVNGGEKYKRTAWNDRTFHWTPIKKTQKNCTQMEVKWIACK